MWKTPKLRGRATCPRPPGPVVHAGETFCLLGANGAGRSTAINLFLDFVRFIRPTGAKAVVDGSEVATDPLALDVTVRNAGSRALNQVRVRLDVPADWQARVDPEFIPQLVKGGEQRVSVVLLSPGGVVVGNYEARLRTGGSRRMTRRSASTSQYEAQLALTPRAA